MNMHNQPAIPSVPASSPYRGTYGFDISFQPQTKENKAATWTYSTSLRKLFVRMATMCPVRYKTNGTPVPPGTVIRAMPVYMKPEHVQEVVRRCPNHATRPEYNEFHKAPQHLVSCDHKSAIYSEDPYTGRLSVLIPYEQPQAGTEWVTYLIQFMCFSSCVGGLNRRPLQLIFTLECNSTVLGRQSVEVRICACPGRDRRTEEKSSITHKGVSTVSANRAAANRARKLRRGLQSSNKATGGAREEASARPRRLAPAAPPAPVSEASEAEEEDMEESSENNETDDKLYTLTVHGRDNLELLKKIRDSLELASLLPFKERQTIYKQQRHLTQPRLFSTAQTTTFTAKHSTDPPQQLSGYQQLQQLALPTYSASTQQLAYSTYQPLSATPAQACAGVISVDQRCVAQSEEAGTENEVSSTCVSSALYSDIMYPGCDSEDDRHGLTITSWLNSLDLSQCVDSFHQRGLYRMSELQNFSVEDLQQIIDVMLTRNKIWRALVEYRNAANSVVSHLHSLGTVPNSIDSKPNSIGSVPNSMGSVSNSISTVPSSMVATNLLPTSVRGSDCLVFHTTAGASGTPGLDQIHLAGGSLPEIIYTGRLDDQEMCFMEGEEVLYAHLVGEADLQTSKPEDHNYCQ